MIFAVMSLMAAACGNADKWFHPIFQLPAGRMPARHRKFRTEKRCKFAGKKLRYSS